MTMDRGWVADRMFWRTLRQWASAANWQRHQLSDRFASLVATEAGVYMLCAHADNSAARNASNEPLLRKLYSCLYAGKTDNLRRRFREHVRERSEELQCFNVLEFWYVVESSSAERTRMEDAMIRAMSPPSNQIQASRAIQAHVGAAISMVQLRDLRNRTKETRK